MGMQGSWGGVDRGGERDDYLVRFLTSGEDRPKVLIYGAGTTLAFRVLHEEGWDVYGSDVGADVVEYRSSEFPGRFFHASDLERSSQGFDIITACEVFEHFHDPMRWLRALTRNLAADGVLCGSTNFYSGRGPIEDDQHVGYMSLGGHVAYWSESSLAVAAKHFGMETVLFELVCPGSVKPDLTYGSLFANKRLFFASRNHSLIERLRERRAHDSLLPCDTSDYEILRYREASGA